MPTSPGSLRLLFLSYWSADDPLTTATVLPHLRLLQACEDVAHICVVTIERDGQSTTDYQLHLPFASPKIVFRPLVSRRRGSVLLTKTEDFTRFPAELAALAKEQGCTFLLARGAPAGSLAYLVWRRTGLPFSVESFEPHGQYMREAGVWSRFDPRYLLEQYWEKQQKKYARFLLPVADNYRQQLISEGVPAERIITVPCSVDLTAFAYHAAHRRAVRQHLGWPEDAVVGVYAGKFGGIYYNDEAFALFRQAADFFGLSFRLLLLTPLPAAAVQDQLVAAGLLPSQTYVAKVPFTEVPHYLSAADFAFGLHRPTPFVSPIKHGEYWANGLPILLPDGVGDDTAIVEREGGGAVFDLTRPGSVDEALQQLQTILNTHNYRSISEKLAQRYRSIRLAHAAYDVLLAKIR
jgi:glycosyltransferase involved in cell wall biosynthesis